MKNYVVLLRFFYNFRGFIFTHVRIYVSRVLCNFVINYLWKIYPKPKRQKRAKIYNLISLVRYYLFKEVNDIILFSKSSGYNCFWVRRLCLYYIKHTTTIAATNIQILSSIRTHNILRSTCLVLIAQWHTSDSLRYFTKVVLQFLFISMVFKMARFHSVV